MLDNFKGELRIFVGKVEDKEKYYFKACIGASKNEDGSWLNYYVLVNFSEALKKEVAKVYKKESFDILLKDGWLKCYRNKEDKVEPILFINKAEVITGEEKKPAKKTKKAEKDEDDGELPF